MTKKMKSLLSIQLQHLLQVFQGIDLFYLFIMPPPAHTRKAQGHARFVPAAGGNTLYKVIIKKTFNDLLMNLAKGPDNDEQPC